MLEEKKLLDFDLNHIIYMCVGPHLNEPLDQIIERKNDEIKNFKKSLWAFNSGVAETVYKLCNQQFGEDETIYCVMIATGKETTKKGKEARYYDDLNGEIVEIPKGMNVTFAQKGTAYALLVDKYYKIIGDNIIYTNEYDNELNYKYVRGFGFLNKVDGDTMLKKAKKTSSAKKVSYIAKLKKPFLVKLYMDNPNNNK